MTGITGGWLFEHWFVCFGKEKKWQKFIATPVEEKNTPAAKELFQHIWASHKLLWYGWLLKGMKDLSNKSTKQMFWLTMAAKAKGLSNAGQDALAKVGFTLQSKIFGLLEGEQLAVQEEHNQQHLLHQPHVWWIDNFNRAYGQTFYKLSSGPMKLLELDWLGNSSTTYGYSSKLSHQKTPTTVVTCRVANL